MSEFSAKEVCEKMGMSGVIVIGFDDTEESLSTEMYGSVRPGIAATAVLAAFYEEALESHKDLSTDDLCSMGALVCTQAFHNAKERIEKKTK